MKINSVAVVFLRKNLRKLRSRRRKKQLFLVTLFLIALCMVLNYFPNTAFQILSDDAKKFHELNIQSRIKSEKGTGCSMPKTNPFAADIMKYIKETFKVRCSGTDWVECIGFQCYVIQKILDTAPKVECYYSDIIYVNDNEHYVKSPIKVIGNKKYILNNSDHVHVYCYNNARHPFSWWSPKWQGVKTGLRHVEVPDRPDRQNSLNLLILGINSISQNQFLRKLPQSYNVLTQKLEAVVVKNYNILGDGTPAALFPILTGKSELEMQDARKINKDLYFDPAQFLFRELHQYGYHTAFFEDSPREGTFQYRFNGFSYQPADHYLRPFFFEATEGYNRRVGAVPRYALMLNLTQQFIKRKGKRFCFTFIADICHENPNLVGTIEDELSDFLKFLKENGILENTLVFVMADHGPRFSDLRSTYQGKIEERLPFMSIILPQQLKKIKPDAETSLKINANVLSTPFDIHTTILDALGLRNLINNYKVPGSELPRGMSLLEPIPETRSCAEADILAHWCACLKWVNVSQNDPIYERVANEFVNFINSLLAENDKCARRELIAIEWVLRQTHNDEVLKSEHGGFFSISKKFVVPSVEHYQVKIVTSPAHAMFESTVIFLRNQNHFLVSEYDVSRVNAYGDESNCIIKTHPHLRKYCYCLS